MAYRDDYSLEPLRIRAWLGGGVVSDKWLPLDGVLLYQAYRYQCGVQHATIPGEYSDKMQIATLPLGITHPECKMWYYQCSWAQWSHEIEATDYWNKRFDAQLSDIIDFGKRRGKIVIKEGPYKSYHMPIFYRTAEWVEWYCVGDQTEIKQLLRTVTHIGKKISQGWGRVRRWEISQWHEDWSVWGEDNKLMRGIPKDDVLARIAETEKPFDFTIASYGIRPSYWERNNQTDLVMPR